MGGDNYIRNASFNKENYIVTFRAGTASDQQGLSETKQPQMDITELSKKVETLGVLTQKRSSYFKMSCTKEEFLRKGQSPTRFVGPRPRASWRKKKD